MHEASCTPRNFSKYGFGHSAKGHGVTLSRVLICEDLLRVLHRTMLSPRCLLLLVALPAAAGHAILISPTARTGMAVNSGIKIPVAREGLAALQFVSDCGGSLGSGDPGQGTSMGTFLTGTDLTVQWSETIAHSSFPGVRIAYQMGDGSTGDFNEGVLAGGTPASELLSSSETTTVTLPSTLGRAVLQFQWVSMSGCNSQATTQVS